MVNKGAACQIGVGLPVPVVAFNISGQVGVHVLPGAALQREQRDAVVPLDALVVPDDELLEQPLRGIVRVRRDGSLSVFLHLCHVLGRVVLVGEV